MNDYLSTKYIVQKIFTIRAKMAFIITPQILMK